MEAATERPGRGADPDDRVDDQEPGPAPAPTTADVLVGGYALLLLILWAPMLTWPFSTPRLVLLLIAAGVGGVLLVRFAVGGDRPALALVALLVCAGLAAAVSHAPLESLIGILGDRTSALLFLCFAGSWAVGRLVSPAGRDLVVRAIVLGIAINGAIALLQVLTDPVGALSLLEGRAAALTPNPVALGGLVAGGLAMTGWWAARRAPIAAACAVAALLGALGNLSGSRAAVGTGIVLAALPVLLHRPDADRDGRRLGRVAVAAALAVSIALGAAATLSLDAGSSAIDRVEGAEVAGSGVAPRTAMWWAGLQASAERPLLGWGPGQFRTATSPRTTAAFVRAEGPDGQFYDAHDLPVELLVTVGVAGLAAAAAFTVLAFRRARGVLAWFSVGLACSFLLAPLFQGTGALLLLALGASMAGDGVPWRQAADAPPARSGARVAWATAAVIAALVGGAWGVRHLQADLIARRGIDRSDADDLAAAQRLVPPDLELADQERAFRGQALLAHDDPEHRRAAFDAARKEVRIDPRSHVGWGRLGALELTYGSGTAAQRQARAEADFRRALELNPWSVIGATGMWLVAGERGDQDALDHWKARLCAVDQCPAPQGGG